MEDALHVTASGGQVVQDRLSGRFPCRIPARFQTDDACIAPHRISSSARRCSLTKLDARVDDSHITGSAGVDDLDAMAISFVQCGPRLTDPLHLPRCDPIDAVHLRSAIASHRDRHTCRPRDVRVIDARVELCQMASFLPELESDESDALVIGFGTARVSGREIVPDTFRSLNNLSPEAVTCSGIRHRSGRSLRGAVFGMANRVH